MSSADAEPDVAIAGGRPERLLGLIALGTIATSVGRLVLAPLLPAIIDDLGISPAQAGLALSVMGATAAVCRYPGGRIADQLSRKTVLVVAFGLLAGGFAVLSAATGYPLLLLGTAAVGVGAGLYVPTAFALLADIYVSRRGESFGINNAAFNLGGVLAAGLATVILARGAWRAGFLPIGVVFVFLLVGMHRWNDEPYNIGTVEFEFRATIARVGRTPGIRVMLLSAAVVAFVWQGTINFLPTYLQVVKAFPPWLASTVFASVFVVGTVITPVSGALGDRHGHLLMTVAATGVGIVGLGLVWAGTGAPVVLVGSLLFALGLTAFWPAMNAYVMGLFPTASRGGDFGAIGTIYIGAGSLGPSFVGLLAEQFSYSVAFLALVPILFVGAAITSWLAIRRTSD